MAKNPHFYPDYRLALADRQTDREGRGAESEKKKEKRKKNKGKVFNLVTMTHTYPSGMTRPRLSLAAGVAVYATEILIPVPSVCQKEQL